MDYDALVKRFGKDQADLIVSQMNSDPRLQRFTPQRLNQMRDDAIGVSGTIKALEMTIPRFIQLGSRRGLERLGMEPDRANRYAGMLQSVSEFFTPIGDAIGFENASNLFDDAQRQVEGENYFRAAADYSLGATEGVLAAIGSIGGPIGKGIGRGGRRLFGSNLRNRPNTSSVMDQIATPNAFDKPLTKAQFKRQYAQHVDLRGRMAGTLKENAKAIQAGGFKKGFNVNALPVSMGTPPMSIVDRTMNPKKGDYVYLAPKGSWKDGGNGMEILDGWKPKPFEVIEVDKDNPNMYEEYLRAFEKSKKAPGLLDGDNLITGAERDANFKNWFGDSKVVDEDGKPLTVYHSTLGNFDEFKTTTNRSLGAHFGSEEAANNRIKSFINRHEENKGISLADKPSQIMPVNLSLKKPFRMDDMISWQPEEVANRINYYIMERNLDMPYIKPKHIIDESKNAVQIYNDDEIVSALKKGGYDGIVYENTIEGGGDSYIAFDPTQIKSIHNQGTYNPKDANILKGIAPIAGAGLIGAGMMRQEDQQPQPGILN